MKKILLFVLSVLLMTSLSAQTKFLELAFTKALEQEKIRWYLLTVILLGVDHVK